jgi:hypothetical protein
MHEFVWIFLSISLGKERIDNVILPVNSGLWEAVCTSQLIGSSFGDAQQR